MSKVTLTIQGRMSAVAAGLLVAGFSIGLTGSDGIPVLVDPLSVGSIPPAAADGTFSVDVDLGSVLPVGSFSGSVQAVDAAGTNIGTAVSFSGSIPAAGGGDGGGGTTPDNLQPLPVSVTVQVS